MKARYTLIEKKLVEGKERYWVSCILLSVIGLIIGLSLGLGLRSSSSSNSNSNSPFSKEILLTTAVGPMIYIPQNWCNQKWCTKLNQMNKEVITVARMGDSTTSGYCVDSVPFQSWSNRQQQSFITNQYTDGGAGLSNCNFNALDNVFTSGCEFPLGYDHTSIFGPWGSFFAKGLYIEIGYLQAQSNPCSNLKYSIDNIHWYNLSLPTIYTGEYQSYFLTLTTITTTIKPFAFNISNINYLSCSIIIQWIRSTTANGIVFDGWGFPGQQGQSQTYPTSLEGGSLLTPDLLIWSFGIWDIYYAGCAPTSIQASAIAYTVALDNILQGIDLSHTDVIIDIPNIGTIICNNNMTLYYTYWVPIILTYAKLHGFVYIDQSIIYASNLAINNWQSFANINGWALNCNGASGMSNIHAGILGYELYSDHSLYVLSATKFGSLPNASTYLQATPFDEDFYYSCPFVCSSLTSSFNAANVCSSVGGVYATGAPGYGC